jgi:hypothetical protein
MPTRLLISAAGLLGLASIVAGGFWLALAVQPVSRGGAPAAWIYRTSASLQQVTGDAILLISPRDACAFVSLGNLRQEIRPASLFSRPAGPRPVTACTPYFPKGSPRR